MHSHERSLLAQLGFSDRDKSNPEHDQAVLYVSQHATLRKIANALTCRAQDMLDKTEPQASQVGIIPRSCSIEHHLQKGQGKYATTVGFLDVLIEFTIATPSLCRAITFAEVKIARPPFGDMLRQLKLYSDYARGSIPGYTRFPHLMPRGILIAPWELSDPENDALEGAGFTSMALGDGFRSWQTEQGS